MHYTSIAMASMSVGITPNLEKGKCSICGKKTKVRVILDLNTGRGFRICEKCAKKSKFSIEDGIRKYGKMLGHN